MQPRRWHDEQGQALVISLMMMAVMMPLGAFAVMQARTDLLIHRHVRNGAEAFYAAESGLEHALADVRRAASFDRLRYGPDAIAGTADDGNFPFIGPAAMMLRAPLRYELAVQARTDELIDITASGYGDTGAVRVVTATVMRGGPRLPAAFYATATSLSLMLGTEYILDGNDRAAVDSPLPALALSSPGAAAELRATLADAASAQLLGADDLPSISTAGFAVDVLASAFMSEQGAQAIAAECSGELGDGLHISSSSVHVSSAEGSGVLVVNGDLSVDGTFTFSGLVIVLGDTCFEDGSTVHISGGVLQTGTRLDLLGTGEVHYDSSVVDELDRRFPRRLPHRAIVVGRRDA